MLLRHFILERDAGKYIMKTDDLRTRLTAGHRGRIKDKFRNQGLVAFHDYEVLELLLGWCIARKDVKPPAKALIERFSTLQGVLDATVSELTEVPGVGEHSALLIKLVRACSDRYLAQSVCRREIISSPQALIHYLRSSMASLRDEQFRVVYLNAKNEMLHDEIIQEGTVDQTAVYPRKIVERALAAGAVSVILVHNHPSGDPAPSAHDRRLTEALVAATKLLSIRVHDHIIIGRYGYYSFAENGSL
jgi:DNA repair protein RadC